MPVSRHHGRGRAEVDAKTPSAVDATREHQERTDGRASSAFDATREHHVARARMRRSTPHMHTDLSPDSNVPIDTYARAALEHAASPRSPSPTTSTSNRGRRPSATRPSRIASAIVRDAAERWGPQGVQIRFGVELTYDRAWEADIRDHLARYAYDFTIGSVHDRVESPYSPRNVAAWVAGRISAPTSSRPRFDEVEAAAHSGLFDAIGHIDNVKRYLYPHVTPAAFEAEPELYERILQALVDTGTALEVNTSGLRYASSRPSRIRRSSPASVSSAATRSPSARTRTGRNTPTGAWTRATTSSRRRASNPSLSGAAEATSRVQIPCLTSTIVRTCRGEPNAMPACSL